MTKAPPKRGHVQRFETELALGSGSSHPTPRRDFALTSKSHGTAYPHSAAAGTQERCVNRDQCVTRTRHALDMAAATTRHCTQARSTATASDVRRRLVHAVGAGSPLPVWERRTLWTGGPCRRVTSPALVSRWATEHLTAISATAFDVTGRHGHDLAAGRP